jgi:hypothetical protein
MIVAPRLEGALELVREARAHVARVIALIELSNVETLQLCAAELSAATRRIEQINTRGGDPAIKPELSALRQDLRRAGLMLRRGWEWRAAFGQSGYTPAGELTPQLVSTSRWAMEG